MCQCHALCCKKKPSNSLTLTNSKASAGWLHHFHERNRITLKVLVGEKKAADITRAAAQKVNLSEVIAS